MHRSMITCHADRGRPGYPADIADRRQGVARDLRMALSGGLFGRVRWHDEEIEILLSRATFPCVVFATRNAHKDFSRVSGRQLYCGLRQQQRLAQRFSDGSRAGGFSLGSCHAHIEAKFREIWVSLLSTSELATGRRWCTMLVATPF
jgi:hypothetical protein